MRYSKAFEDRVRKILNDKRFIIGEEEEKLIDQRLKSGSRYFYLAAIRDEGDLRIERFIKIPRINTSNLLRPFQRQIEFAQYIKKHGIVQTRGVIEGNSDPNRGDTFAIFETFPKNQRIGFIEDDHGTELLGEKAAASVFNQLDVLHNITVSELPRELLKILRWKKDVRRYVNKVYLTLNRPILTLDSGDKPEKFGAVLERRLKIHNLQDKIKQVFKQIEPLLNAGSNHRNTLVHGDISPSNLFVYDNGEVELLDFEWASVFQNHALAEAYDFGHLRARAWPNENFRKILDGKILRKYSDKDQPELGEAIVKMGILTSHLGFSRCFENYDLDKQRLPRQILRKEETEKDIVQIFYKLI